MPHRCDDGLALQADRRVDVRRVDGGERRVGGVVRAVADRVRERAAELSLEAERVNGEACLSSLDWLEARGLEPDYLPEPNGPEEYFVMVTESVPSFSVGKPTYE